jgi:hypothetical protein
MASVRFDSGISNFPNPGSSFYRFSLFLPVVISFISHHPRFSVFVDLRQTTSCFLLRGFLDFPAFDSFQSHGPIAFRFQ